MPGLTKNLFKTFIITTVVAVALNCVYYVIVQRGQSYDYQHAVTLIAGSTLVLTVILLIMTLPSLFLNYPQYWANKLSRVLLYFSGPVVFIIAVFNIRAGINDKVVDLITVAIFLSIHSFFYYRLTQTHK